jgi:hydrogenase maturation factor
MELESRLRPITTNIVLLSELSEAWQATSKESACKVQAFATALHDPTKRGLAFFLHQADQVAVRVA